VLKLVRRSPLASTAGSSSLLTFLKMRTLFRPRRRLWGPCVAALYCMREGGLRRW